MGVHNNIQNDITVESASLLDNGKNIETKVSTDDSNSLI